MNNHVFQLAEDDQEIEVREITEKLSLDALAVCVFGFPTDSFSSKYRSSKFHANAKGFFQKVSNADKEQNLSTYSKMLLRWKSFKIYLDFHIPNIIKQILHQLGFNVFGHFLANEHSIQLMSACSQVLEKYNKKKGNQVDNMMSMMMEAIHQPPKFSQQELDADQYEKDAKIVGKIPIGQPKDNDVISAALLMLSAGYDATGTAMAFVLYELATNPNCQSKLLSEINQAKEGDLDIPYLDAVINESMRKNPILANLERVCTEDYHFEEHNYKIKKGEMIRVSNVGICLDPDIFPKPHQFYPERFLNDGSMNKSIYKNQNKNPFAFGLGPRNCLAWKFAMYEMKIGIIGLVKEFKLIPGDKTPEEIQWNPLSILGVSKDGLWIKCKKR